MTSLTLSAPVTMWAKLSVRSPRARRNIKGGQATRITLWFFIATQPVMRLIGLGPQLLEMVQRRECWRLFSPGTQHRRALTNARALGGYWNREGT